jgi:hypothetical protein
MQMSHSSQALATKQFHDSQMKHHLVIPLLQLHSPAKATRQQAAQHHLHRAQAKENHLNLNRLAKIPTRPPLQLYRLHLLPLLLPLATISLNKLQTLQETRHPVQAGSQASE